jgi:hypothetical protein
VDSDLRASFAIVIGLTVPARLPIATMIHARSSAAALTSGKPTN